ncbi:hypothetical protein G7Z17_g1377 [Cylindrodendrum hubeiense]|uniref:Uncharacterized protein n=1 Tax=Cylindrodendrum hubeiense TaxID=595255 RepID=A0A9P5HMY6_9HYPO|nr:hypothetical protein G7Z17_g1377 [Cylindrodendrum hubeiense]
MAVPFRELVAEQRMNLPVLATPKLCSGKVYIVTGANTGLGLEAARHVVAAEASKVILAVRNVSAGNAAKADIESTTKSRDVVEVWQLDLASYDSVKAFAKKVTENLDRLDCLIENAGVALDKWVLAEGHESTIAINVMGTLLLGVLLFPKLVESARRYDISPRLVLVTSEAGFTVRPEFDKIRDDPLAKMDDQKTADIGSRYQLSKLVQNMALRHLATLLPVSRTGVVINAVNPGLCKTQLSRNVRLTMRIVITLANSLLGRSVEMGSRTLVHAAVAGKESHGCYLGACEIKENQVPSWAIDEEGKQDQKRIWDDIAKELEKVAPGCVERMLSAAATQQ